MDFYFDRPEPILAWIAFQRFVVEPLSGLTTTTVGYECEHSDGDDRLWLVLVREFAESSQGVWRVGCCLSAWVPCDWNDVSDRYWHWEEHETLAEWIDIVEASHVFWKYLAVEAWRWEGFAA